MLLPRGFYSTCNNRFLHLHLRALFLLARDLCSISSLLFTLLSSSRPFTLLLPTHTTQCLLPSHMQLLQLLLLPTCPALSTSTGMWYSLVCSPRLSSDKDSTTSLVLGVLTPSLYLGGLYSLMQLPRTWNNKFSVDFSGLKLLRSLVVLILMNC